MTIPVHVHRDVHELARGAADEISTHIGWAITLRGRASLAVSGGSTPWLMLNALKRHAIQWDQVHIFQVDERVAPDGHPDRNATQLQASLLDEVPIPSDHIHLVPMLDDPESSALEYERTLLEVTGGTIDVVHLGLGDDGHTASLVPDDPVLDEHTRFVAATGEYRGTRRVTLTYPCINAAGVIVWVTNGSSKAAPLRQLLAADTSIPAGAIRPHDAVVHCDEAAVSPQPPAG